MVHDIDIRLSPWDRTTVTLTAILITLHCELPQDLETLLHLGVWIQWTGGMEWMTKCHFVGMVKIVACKHSPVQSVVLSTGIEQLYICVCVCTEHPELGAR